MRANFIAKSIWPLEKLDSSNTLQIGIQKTMNEQGNGYLSSVWSKLQATIRFKAGFHVHKIRKLALNI